LAEELEEPGCYIERSSISRYEKSTWPTPPKLLSMARAYKVAIGEFFKTLGARDEDICGHQFSPQEKEFISYMKGKPDQARWHQKLQKILEDERHAEALCQFLDMIIRDIERD
jgi:transcriptional regulator with XRE-family HTH domain